MRFLRLIGTDHRDFIDGKSRLEQRGNRSISRRELLK
jgi:hypothetical protein